MLEENKDGGFFPFFLVGIKQEMMEILGLASFFPSSIGLCVLGFLGSCRMRQRVELFSSSRRSSLIWWRNVACAGKSLASASSRASPVSLTRFTNRIGLSSSANVGSLSANKRYPFLARHCSPCSPQPPDP